MAPDIIFVLCVISLGFLMFIFELFSIDVTAMILLTIFFMLGYLTPQEALSGFSNPAVITIAFLFIISHALQKTRILEYLIVRVRRLADRSILLGRAVYLFTIGIASAVVNNTAIVAIFMPVSIYFILVLRVYSVRVVEALVCIGQLVRSARYRT